LHKNTLAAPYNQDAKHKYITNPLDVIKGRDPQLERAVQEALTLLKTQAVEIKPEPPAPVKYKRPVKN
jgi:hypothetical protein